MILLVVGLVAVIVVVLIAVFLSIRLGHGDEDDEAELRPSSRDRRHDQDERWRDRDTRRVPASSGRGGSPGYGSRGPARDQAPRGRDYDAAARRPAREAADYRKPASARAPVGASAQARSRYDSGPSRRPAADDFPSADYPSMDFGPAGSHPSGDHPSVEFPVADYAAMDDRRDRPDSRRKAAPAPAAAKSTRSRQRGKRGDDDDWPSTEWDRLSDEQYWAELSADKPLSTMARPPSRPASNAAAATPANGSAKAKPAARDSRPARPPVPERDLPGRKERSDQREPATERLPIRAARQAAPPVPPARREADALAAGRSYPDPRSALDPGPRPPRDTGPHAARNTGPYPARDTGPQPRPEPRRRDTTGPQPARDRDLAMLTGLASAPPPIPGALDDDPLTSPSFSLKSGPATDSRSYSNARKHAKTGPAADHPAPNGADHANGTSGSYPVSDHYGPDYGADYADPGYAYHAAPPAAVPPPAPAAEWYSAPPEAQAPAYGNPYQHNGPSNGYADSQATASYANYAADPLRVYSPPGYEAPAPYAEPPGPAAYQAPPAADSMPYADGYQAQPYPDPASYPDGYSAGGYAPGYEGGYGPDPYAPGGYGPYPPQA
jgi:hypothetical protein